MRVAGNDAPLQHQPKSSKNNGDNRMIHAGSVKGRYLYGKSFLTLHEAWMVLVMAARGLLYLYAKKKKNSTVKI